MHISRKKKRICSLNKSPSNKVPLLLLNQESPKSINSGTRQSIQDALIDCVTLRK